jgi:hypothetical protein
VTPAVVTYIETVATKGTGNAGTAALRAYIQREIAQLSATDYLALQLALSVPSREYVEHQALTSPHSSKVRQWVEQSCQQESAAEGSTRPTASAAPSQPAGAKAGRLDEERRHLSAIVASADPRIRRLTAALNNCLATTDICPRDGARLAHAAITLAKALHRDGRSLSANPSAFKVVAQLQATETAAWGVDSEGRGTPVNEPFTNRFYLKAETASASNLLHLMHPSPRNRP